MELPLINFTEPVNQYFDLLSEILAGDVIFIRNYIYIKNMVDEQQLLKKLDKIEQELGEIKEHMVDVDSIMTEEDYEALLAYRKEKSARTLTSHENLKKELEL